jgi:hypothetical protein
VRSGQEREHHAAATAEARSAIKGDALACVVAFSPTDWTFICFRLWRGMPKALAGDAQLYAVGHVSLP